MPREGDTELTGGPWGPGGPGVSDEQAQEEGKAGHVSPSLWKKRNNLLNGPPPSGSHLILRLSMSKGHLTLGSI